jgi:CDP-4-dehydro-6-deoxyglucose reductase
VVTVSPTGEQILLEPGETILEGLYKAGYSYRIGCRRGGCGICKVDLLDGEVTYNRVVADTVLTDVERAAGTCLTCRAVPSGPITIALREETLRRVNPFLSMLRRPPAS